MLRLHLEKDGGRLFILSFFFCVSSCCTRLLEEGDWFLAGGRGGLLNAM